MTDVLEPLPDRVPGLRYVSDEQPGIRRRRAGKGFTYTDQDGKRLRDRDEIERIRKLAVPPAWTDVWICPSDNGHILATGRDAKGRKQYRYHPRWREVRDAAKFDRTIVFGEMISGLRRQIRKDMARTGLPKEKVVATVVALLDSCFARVGNECYAKENGSFGLTTLRNRHVTFKDGRLELRFKGKSGKYHETQVDDPRIVHIVRKCQDIEGQELFQYLDQDRVGIPIGSADVNEYLREVTGQEFSAKDFRTWAGTVLACTELAGAKVAETEKARQATVIAAIDEVAGVLGNTRAVCRSSYIHPDVIDGYSDGSLAETARRRPAVGAASLRGLTAEERLLLAFLKSRARKRAKAA